MVSDMVWWYWLLLDGALKGHQCRDLLKAAGYDFKLDDYLTREQMQERMRKSNVQRRLQHSGIVATYRGMQGCGSWRHRRGLVPLLRARPGDGVEAATAALALGLMACVCLMLVSTDAVPFVPRCKTGFTLWVDFDESRLPGIQDALSSAEWVSEIMA
jgi:hypothetical protein